MQYITGMFFIFLDDIMFAHNCPDDSSSDPLWGSTWDEV